MITFFVTLIYFAVLIIAVVLDAILLLPVFLVVYIYRGIKAKLDERKLIKEVLEKLREEEQSWEKTKV